jgi:hypothetical protein
VQVVEVVNGHAEGGWMRGGLDECGNWVSKGCRRGVVMMF